MWSVFRSPAFNFFAKDAERWSADKTQLADIFALAHTDILQKFIFEFHQTFQFATVPAISCFFIPTLFLSFTFLASEGIWILTSEHLYPASFLG